MSDPSTAAAASEDLSPHEFQAEVSRLLDLMIHSVYTEREIFMRELISNASDACDKLRYEAIARPELISSEPQLAIRISMDPAAGKLTLADNGIGMSRRELVDNLGTIARSGTRAFMESVSTETKASDKQIGAGLIGQFGVGFYSAFMVADEIEVVSQRAGEAEAHLWVSRGAGFKVGPAPAGRQPSGGRGTVVTLTLKADAKAFLEPDEIERIVRTYSDHILFPVELVAADGTSRQINAASALWQRSKSEVTEEQYKEAFRSITGEGGAPAMTVHWRAEGRQSYAVMLFVPETRPFDLFDPERKGRVRLYVRRVYITEEAALLPSWLRFVRGVVDSEDIPLNISREMLQNNPQLAQIRRALTSRILTELESLAEKDHDRFLKVWETFGGVIKEGIYEDAERRDQLLKLVRARSTAGPGWRSLAEYVAALKPNQTAIYYITGDTIDRLKASPQLEAARARGIEVLLLSEPVDSFWTALPLGFDGKPLVSLSRGEVDLASVPLVEPEKVAAASDERLVAALIAAMKTALGDSVGDVKASKRLVDSAACLVAPAGGPDLGLERILERHNRGIGLKPILEINPGHAVVKAAMAAQEAREPQRVHDLACLMLDQAMILDGQLPSDPGAFAMRLSRLVAPGG
jgi:molecular chaperone HtpG